MKEVDDVDVEDEEEEIDDVEDEELESGDEEEEEVHCKLLVGCMDGCYRSITIMFLFNKPLSQDLNIR